PVSVAGAEGRNLSVASLTVDRSVTEGRERATLTARLVSSGSEAPGTVPVILEIDERPVETKEVALGESRAGTVEFDPLTLPAESSMRGRIRLPDDDLALDNDFHFVLSADQRIGALGVAGPGTPPQASVSLDRALRLGRAPGFRVETRSVGRLTAADLDNFPVMFFNQTALPGGEIGRRLQGRVEGGAGMVFVAGDNSLGEWDGVLPGLGRTVDRSSGGGTTL